METEEFKKKAADTMGEAKENVQKMANDLKEVAEEVMTNITENKKVKAMAEKITDAARQLRSSETTKQAEEFVKEQGERAGEFLRESMESLENSELFKKLKDTIGLSKPEKEE